MKTNVISTSVLSDYVSYQDILNTAPQVDWGLIIVGSATEPGSTLSAVSS